MLEGARILVVEDDAAINRVVCSYLGKMGAMCTAAFSGTEGLMHLAGGEDFHLVITDLMLPGASGEEVVAAARAAGLPVVVLSARATVADRVDLLRIGADDYLTKPFDLEELLARCEAVLRRSAGPGRAGDIRGAGAGQEADVAPLRFGAWELDETARAFTAAGMPVRLTRTEFEIVRTLMAAPRRVHTKRALSIAAGGDAAALEESGLSLTVSNAAEGLGSLDANRLGERFYRGDPSRRAGGSGLGLATARSLADAMGLHLRPSIEGDRFIVTFSS